MSERTTSSNQPNHSGRAEFIEENREALFITLILGGILAISLGLAFLILGLSLDTNPPSPYLATMTDRYLLLGFSLGAILVGALLGRLAFRTGGW